mmetsp:Transcript_30867/g.65325  ORF Transcript_30867/g.65325 Transcript_30867/m.65325 type:complete len:1087 (-) Transcript_30867:255-3515(-)
MDPTGNKKRKNQRRLPTKQKKARDEGGKIATANKDKKHRHSLPHETLPPQPPKNKKRKPSNKEDKKSPTASASPSKLAKKSTYGNSRTEDATANAKKGGAFAGPTSDSPQDCFNYIGVTFRSPLSKYEARTCRGSHEFNLGLFDLACDAALAYDVAYRITGGSGSKQQDGLVITNDVEEIKYALNWLDQAGAQANGGPKGNEPGVNFTTPSMYREARRKEIGGYLTGSIHHPTFDFESVPQEEEVKMRIKKEILNLAKAYVVATQGLNNEEGGGGAVASNKDEKNQKKYGDNKERALSSLLKKKTWVPESSMDSHNRDGGGETTVAASRKEEAEALLALQKKCHNETKKEALAHKLEKIMSGNVGAKSSLSLPALRDDPGTAATIKEIKGNDKRSSKVPESKETKPATSTNRKKPLSIKDDSTPQLLKQKQQAALDNWKIAAAGYCSSLLPGSGVSGNGQPSSNDFPEDNNSTQEQVWVPLAAQHPDVVNKSAIRNAQQDQQAMEAAEIMKAAKMHSSMQANGASGGDARQLQPPSFSSKFGLEPPGSSSTSSQPNKAENKKQPKASPSTNSSQNSLDKSNEGHGSDTSVTALLAGMGHKGPIPPGLREHLQLAIKQQQQQQQLLHCKENQARMPEAASLQENGSGGKEDPHITMQRQLANETKKAALAQKLSTIMSGCNSEGIEARTLNHKDGVSQLESNQLKEVQGAMVAQASLQQNMMLSVKKKTGPKPKIEALTGNNTRMNFEQAVKQNSKSAGEKSHKRGIKDKEMKASIASRERKVSLKPDMKGNIPEQIVSASASASATPIQQPSLDTMQAFRGVASGVGLPDGIDEQAAIQSLMLKNQMQEINKRALEQKVLDHIQGRGLPEQPSLQASGMELSHNVALQSLLQAGGNSVQQSLLGHPSDLARENAIQALLANQQGPGNQISEALTHDVVHRRLALNSMLMSEENRLRQLREALQNELVSDPQQQLINQVGAGLSGLVGNRGGQAFNANSLHELMLEREQRAMQDEIRRSILTAELNASIVEQNSQEMALRQALALRSSQEADISLGRLLEAARSHGLDPQTMTPAQLAQLMGMIGGG